MLATVVAELIGMYRTCFVDSVARKLMSFAMNIKSVCGNVCLTTGSNKCILSWDNNITGQPVAMLSEANVMRLDIIITILV